jgi:hypothetical protein
MIRFNENAINPTPHFLMKSGPRVGAIYSDEVASSEDPELEKGIDMLRNVKGRESMVSQGDTMYVL